MSLNPLRSIPSVNELLESAPLGRLVERISHSAVVSTVRTVLEELRSEFQGAAAEISLPSLGELAERIARRVMESESQRLRPVINATGTLLHAGLGGPPLAQEAIDEIAAVAGDYANLDVDLASAQSARRALSVERLLTQLTGAEAALVVNNNAGATMLALAALAAGRQVIVSRGEVVEIGGSYRLPDVIAASGASLCEVGATNDTRPSDYLDAISAQTAAILLVHPSNYAIVGASKHVSVGEIAGGAHTRQVALIHDVGSGALVDFAAFGLSGEPLAAESLRAGADVVLFSGDKLLGGPQCGILLGRRELIDRIERHPLSRALRVGKLTLAALGATLRLYQDPAKAARSIPLLHLLATPVENLKNRAERMAPQMAAAHAVAAAAAVEDVASLSGGSIPSQQLKTWCVALEPEAMSVDQLAAALRQGNPAVVGRIQQGRVLIDLRTVSPRNDLNLVEAVTRLASAKG